jgi:hypothetical protein
MMMSPASSEQERLDAVMSPNPPAAERTKGKREKGKGKSNTDTRYPTPNTRSLSRRRRLSLLLLLAVCALLVNLFGCGSGLTAFSGGGFPIGKALVVGRVVSAEDPQIVFAGVRISLSATPPGGATENFETITDANGNFQITNVPTGQVSGAARMEAIPADATIRAQSLFFSVVSGKKRGLFIALPKTSFDVTQAKSLHFVPPSYTLRPGDTVRVNAQLRDENGTVLPVLPSLIYDADLGTVGGDGTFSGVNEGTGIVSAQWYNNLSATATIKVDVNAPSLPPPPPRNSQPSVIP